MKEIPNKMHPTLASAESMKSPKIVLMILHERFKGKNSIHFYFAEHNHLEEWLLKITIISNCFLCFFSLPA